MYPAQKEDSPPTCPDSLHWDPGASYSYNTPADLHRWVGGTSRWGHAAAVKCACQFGLRHLQRQKPASQVRPRLIPAQQKNPGINSECPGEAEGGILERSWGGGDQGPKAVLVTCSE